MYWNEDGVVKVNGRTRLIETWDVLKLTWILLQKDTGTINRNMRCIEIADWVLLILQLHRLIETWDVLKSRLGRNRNRCRNWLIETWDVLKFCSF